MMGFCDAGVQYKEFPLEMTEKNPAVSIAQGGITAQMGITLLAVRKSSLDGCFGWAARTHEVLLSG